MKTTDIIRAFKNAARFINIELAEKDGVLWADENSPEISAVWRGKDHHGWFIDDFCNTTVETLAVQLIRFPRMLFYAVKHSDEKSLCIHLRSSIDIDYAGCENERHASDAVEETATELISYYDRKTQAAAEASLEILRVDNVKDQISENEDEIAALESAIKTLSASLATLKNINEKLNHEI